MSLETKKLVIGIMGMIFLGSLVFVQYEEVTRRRMEHGRSVAEYSVPAASKRCVECHQESTPGAVEHWKYSTHAEKGVACLDCHKANKDDADAWKHEGEYVATIVTPMDCARCHTGVTKEFTESHHAKAGNILASLDNFLAETVEGSRIPFNPHSKTPGRPEFGMVNGLASVNLGCKQCHGSTVALMAQDGSPITVADLKPDDKGKPTAMDVVAKIKRGEEGKPILHPDAWPNTGIGRINLDGSLGSCSACHSRHDFSRRRARQPENCGKCHLGPDHPQKEIYEESKHGVAYRDLIHLMNLDSEKWILGQTYSAAPTCATCHMSGNTKNGGKITHDPGKRISWTNRPPVSAVMDTDKDHKVVKESDPDKRAELIADSWQDKRERMKNVCLHCHSGSYVNSFYKQYDSFIHLYNEKFAKPGASVMKALKDKGLITKKPFDEKIEWTWFYLWHHEGRRARHGAAMMAPDYAHWHGMYEVSERFYQEFVPEVKEILEHARKAGLHDAARDVEAVLNEVMARPEHVWIKKDH